MRKVLWIAGIVLAAVLVLLLVLTAVMKSYLKSDRLKALAVAKLETLTGRVVTIHSLDVSLFKGVVVKGVEIKGRNVEEDFVRMQEFVLDYRLLPLLKRQLVVTKVEMISPFLFVRRMKDGTYNFSDITAKRAKEAQERKEGEETPLTLVVDRIEVRNATVKFMDSRRELPDMAADIPAIALKAAYRGESPVITGHVDLKSLSVALGKVQTRTSGKIDIAENALTVALTTALGKDTVNTSGVIRNYLSAPDARLDFHSSSLDLDALVPPEVKKTAAKEGGLIGHMHSGIHSPARGYRVLTAAGAQKQAIRAAGRVTVDSARYSGYALRNLLVDYGYSDGTTTLSPLQTDIAGGDKVIAAGMVKGVMLFRSASEGGSAAEAIKNTLAGKAVVDLNKVEVRSSRITEAIAAVTGISELRSPSFDRSVFNINIRDRKMFLDGSMNSSRIRINPTGTVAFNKRMDILADLRLSPELASRLSRAKLAGYIKDQEGWSVVPLKISGTTEKPSVALNLSGVGKRLQKGLQQELEQRFLKGLLPQQKEGTQPPSGGRRPEDLLKGIFGK